MQKHDSVSLLVRMLEEAYDKQAWHGPNLRGAIRRVNAGIASWRPDAARKNIAELTAHAAYWKYVAWRRLTGAKRGTFPLRGSNWFDFETPIAPQDWKALVALLDAQHRQFVDAVNHLSPSELSKIPKGAKITNGQLIYSMAMHDVYHAGQIQLIKRLFTENRA